MNKFVYFTLIIFCYGCKPKEIIETSLTDSLVGNWKLKTTCRYETSISNYRSETISYNSDGSFFQTLYSYTNSDCTNLVLKEVIAGTYVIGTDTSRTDFYTSAHLNSTLGAYEVTPGSVSIANSMNSSVFCGYSDWTSGAFKNIIGRTCNGVQLPSAGTVEYSFFNINLISDPGVYIPQLGTTIGEKNPGETYFGQPDSTHDGTTPENRFVSGGYTYVRF